MPDSPGGQGVLRADDADAHHVDVQRAEDIFNELSRQLSKRSSDDLNRTRTVSPAYQGKDLEKLGVDGEERFDLREYLQSSNDAHQSAGIKHKHVGVTWEDLQVDVFGGFDFKVSHIVRSSTAHPTMLIALYSFISVLLEVRNLGYHYDLYSNDFRLYR